MLLEAKNIHKSYKNAKAVLHILKGIDIKIREGEIVAIVGPSGAGKSTLLHILGGLDYPNEGHVVLQGDDIYKFDDKQRARIRNSKIGFVFQFYHLLPEFNAVENVILPLLIKENRSKTKEMEAKGVALLEEVGLKDRLTHKPQELSGGEQQRVAIARALINEPQIIYCDEPTGNLDSETGREIVNMLMELNKKRNQTLVMVTHDQNIAKLSDRVLNMRDGKLI